CEQLGNIITIQFSRGSDSAVYRIGTTTRKNKLSGHKGEAGVASAHENSRLAARPVDKQKGCGVTRSQSFHGFSRSGWGLNHGSHGDFQ
ncbi:hypothetical protein, partial [Paraburkholderia sp. SIMBA_054]|uniref:hypothetical protein n=1 Tax=Paraburkholderia sp. SIMBA_054 TaxID=3085795 RepID=UPI003979FB9C